MSSQHLPIVLTVCDAADDFMGDFGHSPVGRIGIANTRLM